MTTRGGKRKNAGRKPYVDEPMVSKTIRFKPSEWSRLQRLADAQDISVGEYVRNIIKKEIDNNE